MRYFLTLSYKGTAYHGWQIQPNAPSVQQTVQEAVSTLLGLETEIVGAGRTDTGVHASYYVAHFDAGYISDKEAFCYHLNAILPRDIAAHCVRAVRDDAHARFSATKREYKYCVLQAKDPFFTETTYQYTVPMNLARMNEAAALLKKTDDFSSFCKVGADNKTNICRVEEAYWIKDGKDLVFTVSADRFLRNMVRAIVGTLIDVGREKITVDEFENIIKAKSRGRAGSSAPAQGLFLSWIDYPDELYL